MEKSEEESHRLIQFSAWYETLAAEKITYKSTVLSLSRIFVDEFLKSDGMCMPEQVQSLKAENLSPELENYKAEIASIRSTI